MAYLVTNGLYTIHRRMHRLLGTVGDRVMLIALAGHHVHLEQQPDGSIGLPTIGRVRAMLDSDVMRRVETTPVAGAEMERLDLELDLLDAAGVRNGEKAIAIFMHAVWSDDLRRRFGEHDDPATIRKWRTERRKAARATEQTEHRDA